MRGIVDRVAKELEPLVGMPSCGEIQRVVVDTGWRAGNFPVVCVRVEVEHLEGGLEELDARDEGLALDAVLVQLIGVSVRGSDKDNAVRHQRLEKSR